MTERARKIIHVDMDAFYASVEQRDDPELRGRPVAVGGSPEGRGVVAAASYEARRFGVRSAMPSARALRACPELVFVRPRFERYRAVSRQVRAIMREFTDCIEPLALDEAYLDVTDSPREGGSATRMAERIKERIREETRLTASAGVSYNKFLAKLASDQDKPDGLFVIAPGEGEAFVRTLDVRRIHGVGPATAARMHALGIRTGADLHAWSLEALVRRFGRAGERYHALARGIDDRPVTPGRARKSIGQETTFDADLVHLADMEAVLERLAARVAERLEETGCRARTLTVKVRFADFSLVTRSMTPDGGFASLATMRPVLGRLLRRACGDGTRVRLLGVSVSGLETAEAYQAELWGEG
jgi:DNA polymerase-4